MKTKVINFYAGPGAGKSTNAAGLFYEMKKLGYSVELVTEYAKDKVWEGSVKVLENQLYVTSNQISRQLRLVGNVDYIITDSPLPVALQYCKEEDYQVIHTVISHYFNKFDNCNVFVDRNKPYKERGRMQTLEQSKAIDLKIEEGLSEWGGIQYRIESNGDISKLLGYVTGV